MSQAAFPRSARREQLVSPAITIMATGIAGVVVFVLGLASGVRGWDVAVLGLAVLTGFAGMMPLLLDASRPPERRQLLMTMLAFAYLLFFVVPVFTRYFWAPPNVVGLFELRTHHPQDIVAAQLTALVGLISMIAGFYTPIGRSVSRVIPKLRPEWSHATALMVALIMLPIGWSLFLAGQFGLIPRTAGTGFLGVLSMSLYFAIALLTFTYLRYRSPLALVFLVIAIPPTMLFSFFTGSKRLFLSPLFMVALAYTLVERRIRVSFAIAGIALLIVLYPVAQFYRQVVQHGMTLNAVQVLRDPGRALSQISAFFSGFDVREYLSYGADAAGNRLSALGVLSAIVRDTPGRVPYQGGWTIGYAFIGFIPRAVWPGKPETTTGQWVTDNYGAGPMIRSNTGASWPGELYFNFGYLGVILGMLLLGIWFRLFQEHFFGPDATLPALLFASAVIYKTARSIGGGLVAPINGPMFYLIPIAVTHLAIQVLSPPARRRMPADTYADSRVLQRR